MSQGLREEYATAKKDIRTERRPEDEDGIELDPDDPRNRFVATEEGWEFYDPGPVTEEEKLEAAQLWDQITQGKASPCRKVLTSKK